MNNESEQTLVSDAKKIQQEVVTRSRVQERSEVLGVPMKAPGHQEQAHIVLSNQINTKKKNLI